MSQKGSFYIKNYRITAFSANDNSHLHTIFIPGGPGLGSEYLDDFARSLCLPGQSFLVDFPGDGSNRNLFEQISWDNWKKGLLSVVRYFSPCVLVTHSFSGMIALSIPELEDELSGIVLMNTSPTRSSGNNMELFGSSDLLKARIEYNHNPTDESLKDLIDAYANHFFLPHELERGKELIAKCAINSISFQWAWQHFFPIYEAKWIPKKIPCMIITGEYDYMCPSSLFFNELKYTERDNIELCMIKNAGHFPWLSGFDAVKDKFNSFYQLLTERHKCQ